MCLDRSSRRCTGMARRSPHRVASSLNLTSSSSRVRGPFFAFFNFSRAAASLSNASAARLFFLRLANASAAGAVVEGGWPSGAGLTGASREGGWLTGGATPASAETGSDGVTTGSSATGPTPGAGTAASVAGGADGVAANTASAAARGAGDSSIISSFFFLMRMRFLSGLGGSSCGAATSLVEREPFRPSCPPEPASPVRAFAPNFSSARRTASSSKALLWDATGIPSRFSSGISSRFSTPSCFANS